MIPTTLQPYSGGAILALDGASRKTGFAVYRGGVVIKSGVWALNSKHKHLDLYNHIADTITQYHVTKVVAEDIYKDNGKPSAWKMLGECRGVIELATQQAGVTLHYLTPVVVKHEIWHYTKAKHGTMSRTDQKQRMCNAITAKGFNLTGGDDEADAIGLLISWLTLNRYAEPKPRKAAGNDRQP